MYFICEPGIELWPILGGRRWAYLLTSDNLWPHVAFSWRPHEQESMWFTAWRDYAQIFCSKNSYLTFIAQYWHWQWLTYSHRWRWTVSDFDVDVCFCPWPIKKSVCLELICLFVFGLGLVCLFVCLFLALVIWGRPRPAANLNRGIEADKPPASSTHQYQWYHSLVGLSVRLFVCLVVCLVLSVCLFLVFDNVHIHAYPTITYHTSNQHP